jgi:hypothetical protein
MFTLRKSQSQVDFVEFVSPLPLSECIKRLQLPNGIDSDVTNSITIGESDGDHCTFRLRVQRPRRGLFDLTIYGVLERLDYGTTQVRIARDYTQHLAATWFITALTVFIGVVGALITQNLFMLALPIGFSIVLYLVERHNYNQIIQMVKTLLDTQNLGEKVNRKQL